MVVVPEDCVGMVGPWLSLREAVLAGSTSQAWRRALLSDEAWEERYELFWGDKKCPPEAGGRSGGSRSEARKFQEAFRARYELLRGLPSVLLKWKICAEKVEITTHQLRQQHLLESRECTQELIHRASYCQAVLRAVARYHNQYKATLGVLQETVVHDMLDEILSDDYTRGWTPKKVAQHALWLLQDQQLNQEWLQLISCGSMTITSGPEFYECVERGAIIISKLEDPGLDETEIRKAIDDIAEQVRARIPEDETSTQNVLKWMNRVLFDELKFRGNTDDYYCLHNSLLSEVLRRRTGIPISLSVLYLCVAWRLGVRLHGVDMPMHFVLMARDREGSEHRDTFIDVFGGGVLLNVRELEAKMSMMGLDIQISEVGHVSPRYFFVRMLRNLVMVLRPPEGRLSSSMEIENRARNSSLLVLCLAQLVTILKDSAEGSTQFYEEQIDLYRWTGTTRLLCP